MQNTVCVWDIPSTTQNGTEHEYQTKKHIPFTNGPTSPLLHTFTQSATHYSSQRRVGPCKDLRYTREQEMKAFLVVLTELTTLSCVPEYRETKVHCDSSYDMNLIIQDVQSR